MLQINGQWTVVGTDSWSDECGAVNSPEMYAHVSLFSDWIWATVRKYGG